MCRDGYERRGEKCHGEWIDLTLSRKFWGGDTIKEILCWQAF